MTEQDVAKVLYLLNVNYKSDAKTNASDMEKRLKLWAAEFMEEDAEVVFEAVRRHIAKSEWYPTTAHIKKLVETIKDERAVTASGEDIVPIKIGNKVYPARRLSSATMSEEEEKKMEELVAWAWKDLD